MDLLYLNSFQKSIAKKISSALLSRKITVTIVLSFYNMYVGPVLRGKLSVELTPLNFLIFDNSGTYLLSGFLS